MTRLFPFRAPEGFLARAASQDPHDPILRQVLPHPDEDLAWPGFADDPLDERRAQPVPGIIAKYPGRALMLVSGECPIHCRFCFRRHQAGHLASPASPEAWQPALDWLAGHPEIREVIFSGGDPLMRSDAFLARLVHQLGKIPHLQRLRVHSRMAVVQPGRIGSRGLPWLTETRLQPLMMLHVNHPLELAPEVKPALKALRHAQVVLLSQTVLLRGVNDDPDILATLMERLTSWGVLPCYLHLLDPVQGAGHFHVSLELGQRLLHQLRQRLPGYAVPRLAQETPGQLAKTVLA